MSTVSTPPTVTLSNAALRCEVAMRGAELRSLCDNATSDEFIWQRDPAFWAASAPILFPVIGRLKDGGYLLDGRFHAIPKHGFARDTDFSLVTSNETSTTLQLTSNAATIALYPYAFTLAVTYSLHKRTLAVEYRVVNRNVRTMFFALGSHPAFNLPSDLGPLESWSIRFDEVEAPVCHRLAVNLLSSASEPYEFDAANGIGLTDETFARDALIFKGIRSRQLHIVHREHGVRIRFDTGGAPVLGIWAKAGAPFVCLEPWWGFDDSSEVNADIQRMPGMLRLMTGDTFATGYSITV